MTAATVRTMRRYEVPIDGIPCRIGLTGDPVAFGAMGYSAGVEFWAEHDESAEPKIRKFTITGTGHPIPPGAVYVGTAPRTPEGIVWHLYELKDVGAARDPEGAASARKLGLLS